VKYTKLRHVPLTNRELTFINQQSISALTKDKMFKGLLTMIVVGIILGFLAPFGMTQFPLLKTMFFWIVTCVIGYFIYAPLIYFSNDLLLYKISQSWLRVAIAVFVAGALMSLIIPLLIFLILHNNGNYIEQMTAVFWESLIVGALITGLSLAQQLIKNQQAQLARSQTIINEQADTLSSANEESVLQLMEKLPLEKRGNLLCLEMDDHYLKVYTDKGHHLILMRFKDALALLESYAGLQTHRSWWVAIDAITTTQRDGRKVSLTLSNSLAVPVSRTYMKNITALNLL
jgi:hypothetical protein